MSGDDEGDGEGGTGDGAGDGGGAPRRVVTTVCSGNICRSPMAAAFLREHLAERGLADVEVVSAGTHALVGRGAMREARAAVAAIRGEAESHAARQLDIGLATDSALILCATQAHRRHILAWWPDLPADKVRLFNDTIRGSAPLDVDDPYGWDQEVFDLAARVIDRAMEAWARRLAEQWGNGAA